MRDLRQLPLATFFLAAVFLTGNVQAQMRWSPTVTLVKEGAWNGPRLADHQPDIQGVWSNDIANRTTSPSVAARISSFRNPTTNW
jgi:hypothetical protein